MAKKYNIAFFGTPSFTTNFLDVLDTNGYTPSLVVTNPDRPSGRGLQLQSPAPKLWADSKGILVIQPERITDEVIAELQKNKWDLFIVIAYGHILPDELINMPTFGTINVHYSLLPKYRGATPVESAILNGNTATGITIQQMRYRLDSGPIIASKSILISPTDTTTSLREKLNAEACLLLPETISSLLNGTAALQEQDDTQATFCKKIKKEDGEVSLTEDPVLLDRKFRAYKPWPGTFFFADRNGKKLRIKIKSAHLEDGRFVIDSLIPEGGKVMSFKEFEYWLKH